MNDGAVVNEERYGLNLYNAYYTCTEKKKKNSKKNLHVTGLSFLPPFLCVFSAVQVFVVSLHLNQTCERCIILNSTHHALNSCFHCIHCARCVPLYSKII